MKTLKQRLIHAAGGAVVGVVVWGICALIERAMQEQLRVAYTTLLGPAQFAKALQKECLGCRSYNRCTGMCRLHGEVTLPDASRTDWARR